MEPRIPISPEQRWKIFRTRALPMVVFSLAFIAVAILWEQTVTGPTVAGEVARVNSIVASPTAGTLTKIYVSPFEVVKKGTPVAEVQPIDPRSSLDLMRSQLDNLRARLNPDITVLGYDLNLQRLRVPLQEQVALRTAESNLKFTEAERARGEAMLKTKVISPQEYDLLLKKKEGLQTKIAQRKQLIADLDREIQKLHRADTDNSQSSVEELLQEHEKKLRELETNVRSLTIRAPIDGMVYIVNRQLGENVTAGEAILTVASNKSDRIVTYLREPFPFTPEVGMEVTIRTRTFHRIGATAHVIRVGTTIEPISNSLLRQTTRPEVGLPIEVHVPTELALRPGGIVDLTFSSRLSNQVRLPQLYSEK
jgi:multidrug resistance efflux pump